MLKQNKVSPCHDDDEIEKIPTTSKVGAGMKHKPHRYNLHDCFKTEYSKQIVFYFLLKKQKYYSKYEKRHGDPRLQSLCKWARVEWFIMILTAMALTLEESFSGIGSSMASTQQLNMMVTKMKYSKNVNNC